MEYNLENFLDWYASMPFRCYKTDSTPDYTPSGASHFYLVGSQERFTSAEIAGIWKNTTTPDTLQRWMWSLAENAEYNRKHGNVYTGY